MTGLRVAFCAAAVAAVTMAAVDGGSLKNAVMDEMAAQTEVMGKSHEVCYVIKDTWWKQREAQKGGESIVEMDKWCATYTGDPTACNQKDERSAYPDVSDGKQRTSIPERAGLRRELKCMMNSNTSYTTQHILERRYQERGLRDDRRARRYMHRQPVQLVQHGQLHHPGNRRT